MHRKYRVLVVEDDAAVRGLVSEHLGRQGYEVVAVESAEQLLETVRGGALEYAVALTDVHLPGMSGVELSRLLLATAPLRPVIVFTGDGDEALARRALEQGATGYILKPFELFELDAALSQAVSMLELVEATETLARAQAETLDDWGEAGGLLPRSWLAVGDERSGGGVGHGARVVSVAGFLAREVTGGLGSAAREVLGTAARAHEIGRLLGPGGEREVAARSAQLLDNLGFDPAVGDVVRDAVKPWSPGVPLAARILTLADALDHGAVKRSARVEAPAAVRAAIAEVVSGAGDRFDPALVALLERDRESVEAGWLLERERGRPGTTAGVRIPADPSDGSGART